MSVTGSWGAANGAGGLVVPEGWLWYLPSMRVTPHNLSRKLSAAWLVLALALPLWPKAAQAYILPADFLCRLVSDSHKNALKDVTLTMSLEVPEGASAQEERLYIKRPERMRWVSGATGQNVLVAREALQAELVANKMVASGPTQELLAVLLFPKGKDLDDTSQRMLGAIASLGVDTALVTLARHADGVAYIIGAHVWEPNKPQVWIDKASYMPVRLRTVDRARAHEAPAGTPFMRELRLLNYAAGLPRLLELYENDQLVRRSEVTQVTINQNLPESLFEPREPRAARP